MNRTRKFAQYLLCILVITGCKENYEPPVIQKGLSYLVVDGFLNNSLDTTTIRLSRTKKLNETVQNSGENNARLTIEDNNGNTLYYFQEQNADGTYILPGMSLELNNKYRLRINTADGKQYLSDELPVVKTPPIDSISWGRTEQGVTVYANTHDPLNNTRYYRWEFTETWQYHAAYVSSFKYVPYGHVVERPANEYFWECWRTNASTQLMLASTVGLSQDIVANHPLRFIPINANELSILYSILVKQFALSRESFEYLENLKRITEQTGSLFDAQPSQLTGNIHDIDNPSEPVLGFMSVSTSESKRIFISNDQVLPWFLPYPCFQIEVKPPNEDTLDTYFGKYGYIPITLDGFGPSLKGVYASTAACTDCRLAGGVTTRPDFWP